MKKIFAVNCSLKVGDELFDPAKPEYRFQIVADSEDAAREKTKEYFKMCKVEFGLVDGPVEITDEQYETGEYPDPFTWE